MLPYLTILAIRWVRIQAGEAQFYGWVDLPDTCPGSRINKLYLYLTRKKE